MISDKNISNKQASGKRHTTIKNRIIRVGLISVVSGAVLCLLVSQIMNFNTLDKHERNNLINIANAYSSAVDNADITANKGFADNLFRSYNDNPDGAFGFILNSANAVFSETGNELVQKGTKLDDVASDPDYKELSALAVTVNENGGSGIEEIRLCGVDYYAAYSEIKNYENFAAYVLSPKRNVTDSVLKGVLLGIAVTLIIISGSAIICRKTAARITRPITDVTSRLEKLAEGDLASPTPESALADETQILVRAAEKTILSLRSYISDIRNVLTGVAKGDLTVSSDTEYRGDFTEIKSSLTMILDSLNSTFTDVDRAAHLVHDCSDQVAGGAVTLSSNAAEEASEMEQLTESVSGIAVKVKHNAERAEQARVITNQVNDMMMESSRDMEEMLRSISELEQSSAEIAKIIGVIDNIAFQTNILALNAAVEAARAGTAGKGFGVVADEVRNLATKSAEAASRTSSYINNSLEAVKKSTALADKASAAMNSVVDKFGDMNEIVSNIAVSAAEQAQTVSRINSGMDLINGSIQSTSSTAEESAAASEELSGQSQLLSKLLSKFRIRK